LDVAVETWPLREAFVISRGAKREAHVVVATLSDGTHVGRGECVPYARYGETVEGVRAAIEARAADLAQCMTREELRRVMPTGAARNAIDCALWDLEAKRSGKRAAQIARLSSLGGVVTCYTISLGTPEEMAAKAAAAAHMPLLKLKLGGSGDAERVRVVRAAVPSTRLVVDANEAWTPADLAALMQACRAAGVEAIEQPLPAGQDDALAQIVRVVPVCADESAHLAADIARLAGRYDAVNIKLDKAGGLTEALDMAAAAKAAGLRIMVGCMVATSLSMAPAMLLAQGADWVDLDGPLLLAADRTPALAYANGLVSPPEPALWG
jgi:L-alanine-DL-glutamate epimerase-like enolase superfamily enzyme